MSFPDIGTVKNVLHIWCISVYNRTLLTYCPF